MNREIPGIVCSDFAVYNDSVFFSAINHNGLYRTDLEGSFLEVIANFPSEKPDTRHLHSKVCLIDQKLYFAPFNANSISIYDLNDSHMTSIDVTKTVGKIHGKYSEILNTDNHVYMIPDKSDYIISIDKDSGVVEYHNEWTKCINYNELNGSSAIKRGSFIRKNKLYMPYARRNILLSVDLKNFKPEIVEIGKKGVGFINSLYDEYQDVLWILTSQHTSILRYDFSTGNTEAFSVDSSHQDMYFPFIGMIGFGNKIILVPYQSSNLMEFDTEICSARLLRRFPEDRRGEWNVFYYNGKKLSDDTFVLMSASDGVWEVYDMEATLNKELYFPDNDIEIALKRSDNIIIENAFIGLSEFIDYC